nr:T9SS type A sorting domain-containing protein [Chitinophaga nivalis]
MCVLCGVIDPENPVNNNSLDDYSSFVINVGLLGVSVEQTLIFPAASTAGCDSLIIGIGSSNAVLSVNLLGGISVQTYNGNVANNDIQTMSADVLRLLHDNKRAEIMLKPAAQFDRVKITLNSSLLGLLNSFRLYYAYQQSTAPAAPVILPGNNTICSGDSTTFAVTPITGNTISWYTAPTGGTSIATGNTLTVQPVETTIYYAEATAGGCISKRTAVTATVKPRPVQPVVNNPVVICKGDTATLTATGTNIQWYNTNGTLVFIGSPYKTIPPATTVYYAQATENGCSSTRAADSVIVNLPPAIPTLAADTVPICIGDSAIFRAIAPANVTFRWYANPTGGNPLISGPTVILYNQRVTQTFYVDATSKNGCVSIARKPVTVLVKPTPAKPVVNNPVAICKGDTATLTATGNNIQWYNTTTGGTLLFTGSPYRINPPATTVYYAQATENGCSSARAADSVIVNLPPAIPTLAADTVPICIGDSAIFRAIAPANVTFRWYANPTGGNPLITGPTVILYNQRVTQTFYVDATSQSGCVSIARKPVTVLVKPTPAKPVVNNPVAICKGDTATLTATGNNIQWYNTATGGTLLFTGTPYKISPPATTVYYAQATENGCSSTRAADSVIVNLPPAIPTLAADTVPICIGDSAIFRAIAPANVTFRWYANPTGGNPLITGPIVILYNQPVTQTYYVDAISKNGCVSIARKPVTVLVKPTPAKPVVNNPVAICKGDTATLTATGNNIQWYNTTTGGTLLFTGSPYRINSPATTVYYAQATENGCSSARAADSVIVNLPPAIPTLAADTVPICIGDSAIFRAIAPANVTFRWYANPTGGNPLITGPIVILYNQPVTQTFYVDATSKNGCVSIARKPVTVLVKPRPANPAFTVPSGIASQPVYIPITNYQPDVLYIIHIKYTDGFTTVLDTTFTGMNDTIPAPYNNSSLNAQASIDVQAINKVTGCKSDKVNKSFTISKRLSAPPLQPSTVANTVNTRQHIAEVLYFYPNPTNGLIQIQTKEVLDGSLLIVNDREGKPVYRLIMHSNTIQLPASLPAGFYIIQVRTKTGKILTGKVILEK